MVSDTEEDVRAYVVAVIQTRPMSEPKLNVIRESRSNDPIMRKVMRFIKGRPHHVLSELTAYHAERASLFRAEGLLLHDDQIVVPTAQ